MNIMRLLSFGLIVTFLIACTHMVVDHGHGPRDFVLIPHVSILSFHADAQEPSGSHASSHHDADTHTHGEWYITAPGSEAPYRPIVSVIIDSYAWLTGQLSIAPPRFWAKASPHAPSRVPVYLRCCAFRA